MDVKIFKRDVQLAKLGIAELTNDIIKRYMNF